MTQNPTTNLKLCLLNAENLFLVFDQPPPKDFLKFDEKKWKNLSSYPNKELYKVIDLAKSLEQINADIIMLCEVGGSDSLKNFNELFLNNKYSPVLIEGNSDRDIHVGFLVKKNLGWYFEILSNKNYLLNSQSSSEATSTLSQNRFSRDVSELRCFKENKEQPFFILLLTHLKSRLNKEPSDPGGFEKRKAELNALIEIYTDIAQKNPKTPISICGDFNGNASQQGTDEEFKPIYLRTQWQDVLTLSQIKPEDRATYYQVRSSGKCDGRQIDYCFLNEVAQPLLELGTTHVYRYKDEYGLNHGIPLTLEAKNALPSDHYPIVFNLKNILFY